MTRALLLAIPAVGLLALPLSASAATSWSYLVDNANLSVPAGQSVTVNVSMQEITDGTGSIYVPGDGLLGVGAESEQTASSSGNAVQLTGATANSADFNDPLGVLVTLVPAYTGVNSASISESLDPLGTRTEGLMPAENPTGVRTVLVGSFTFTAPANAAGETTQFVIQPDPTSTTNVDWNFTPFTVAPVNVSVTVTAVPEPASLGLLGLGGLLVLRRRR